MKSVTFSDKNYVATILAALLHDIGKFAQKHGVSGKHEEIGKSYLNRTFLSSHYNLLDFYFRKDLSENLDYNTIVHISDWISSGERYNESPDENDSRSNREKKLINILSEVGKEQPVFEIDRPLSLDPDDISNPKEDSEVLRKFKQDFEKINQKLEQIKSNLENDEELFNRLVIRLISDLLKKYTFYSTSAWYYSKQDISLFAHSRISASIAACLYHLHKNEKANLDELKEELKAWFDNSENLTDIDSALSYLRENNFNEMTKPSFLIIRGNFSGIQDFVSEIFSKKALKMLKARSTYLSLLNRLIPIKLVELLNLPEANIVFSGGGNFEIIAPSLPEILDKLKDFEKEINQFFWGNFNGKLFLEFTLTEVPLIAFHRLIYNAIFSKEIYEHLKNKDNLTFLNSIIKNSSQKQELLISSKTLKFKDQLTTLIERGSELDSGVIEGSDEIAICEVCHKRVNKNDVMYKAAFVFEEEPNFCEFCSLLVKLNKSLKQVQKKKKISKQFFNESERWINLFKIGNFDLLDYWHNLVNLGFEIQVNRVDKVPFEFISLGYPLKDDNNQIIEFENLVKKAKGGKRLAALKMDMDNLGLIFRDFTPGNNKKQINMSRLMTFSKYYQLSAMFSLFFEGIINEFHSKKYSDNIYIVFSGGDDAFFIGPWNELLEFSFDLYKLLKQFAKGNPNITLSAGYFIFEDRFPVYLVYKVCDEYLDAAKDQGKNRINLNGLVLEWADVLKLDEKLFDVFRYDEMKDSEIVQLIKTQAQYLAEACDSTEVSPSKLFISIINVFYGLLKLDMLHRSSINKMYLLTQLSLAKISNKTALSVPKVWLYKYILNRNLNNSKCEEFKHFNLNNFLWTFFRTYFTRVLVDSKFNKDILLYALKFVLFLTKPEKEGEKNE